MKKKALIFLLIATHNLQAACVYVTCEPSVSLAITVFTQSAELEFLAINKELQGLSSNYKEYDGALKTNNQLYDQNIKLKAEYLLVLKEISHTQEIIKNEIK